MEWTSPRPQHQFSFPQLQPQPWHHYDDEEIEEDKEVGQEQTPYSSLPRDDRYASVNTLLPPRPIGSFKMELPSTFGSDSVGGMAFPSFSTLSMPQIEEATDFQSLYSAQDSACPANTNLSASLPPLPAPPSQQPQQVQQQQYGGQLTAQFGPQYSEFPTGLASYYPPSALPPSTLMPQAGTRPSMEYFPDGIPSLHNNSTPTLPSSFGSVELQHQQLQPVLDDQEDEFDNSVPCSTGPSMFNSPLRIRSTDTEPSSSSSVTLPVGAYPGRQSPEPCVYSPARTVLAGRKRGLSEPFTTMATSDEPKFSPDKRKLCCVEGCKSQARAFNRCKRHGGSKRCSSPGCTKSVQSRGLCIRHGGGSRCQEPGCSRASQSHGRCKMHGGGRPCIVAGCEKKAHLKRLCRKHGGGTKCFVSGCEKWAQRQGMCMTHSKVVATQPSAIGIIGDSARTSSPAQLSPDSTPPPSLQMFTDEI